VNTTPIHKPENKFFRLKRELIKFGALNLLKFENFVIPHTPDQFVPALWEFGIDDRKLAMALSRVYSRPIFSGKIENHQTVLKSSSENCPWLIVDQVLYVTNPYDRNQIESLIRRNNSESDVLQFSQVAIISKSDFDSELFNRASHDFTELTQEKELFWATEFVDQLLTEAIQRKASDIHINPEPFGGIVKLRIDGRCEMVRTAHLKNIPRDKFRLITNNLMERAGKQNNYLEPSSGYILFELSQKKFNFRLEMAPVKVFTEKTAKITLRILNSTKSMARLEHLGMSNTDIEILQSLSRRPNGMIIITGPTGSGKSTTLKMILRKIRDYHTEKTIFTIEDPVEEQIEGIVSLEVSNHMDFSGALRSILRHDPDVIMIGEIRDQKTAELALRASMTGHLVLTTLHTNDAHGAICRLREFGLQDSLVADNLLAVTAQRLINKVCSYCATMDEILLPDFFMKLNINTSSEKIEIPVVSKQGCEWCNKGYSGRQVINEILENNFDVSEMIIAGLSGRKIRHTQLKHHIFRDMWDDGVRLIKNGVVSMETVELHLGPFMQFKGIEKEKKFM
jgi:type II secretory ATPase GspE/PulE/Tfp pilus assembly ATPase PilB-like protein